MENKNQNKSKFYQIWQTSNQILCQGRILSVSEPLHFILTFFAINIPIIIHQILHFNYFTLNGNFFSVGITLTAHLICGLCLFLIGISDPGILMKINRRYQIEEELKQIPINNKVSGSNLVSIRGYNYNLKMCKTCNIYRCPRTMHCDSCGNCIQRFDRHCFFLGTCIGKRNIKYFYVLLLSLTILSFSVLGMCAEILRNDQQLMKIIQRYPMAIVFLIMSIFIGTGMLLYTLFYTYLLARNLTAYQFEKNIWKTYSGNPFQSNFWTNFWGIFISNQSQTKIQLKKQIFIYPTNIQAVHLNNQQFKIDQQKHIQNKKDTENKKNNVQPEKVRSLSSIKQPSSIFSQFKKEQSQKNIEQSQNKQQVQEVNEQVKQQQFQKIQKKQSYTMNILQQINKKLRFLKQKQLSISQNKKKTINQQLSGEGHVQNQQKKSEQKKSQKQIEQQYKNSSSIAMGQKKKNWDEIEQEQGQNIANFSQQYKPSSQQQSQQKLKIQQQILNIIDLQ